MSPPTFESLRDLSRDELIALVLQLAERLSRLEAELDQFKRPPTTSRNSSQAPSRDQKANVPKKVFLKGLTAALHRLLDQRRRFHFIAWTHDASWDDPLQRPHVRPGWPWDLLRKARYDVTYVVISRERQAAIARAFNYPQYKLRVIPNGVYVRFWWNLSPEGDELITKLGLLDGDIFLLQPARITRLKYIAYALRVVAAMKARGVAPRFVVTGPPAPQLTSARSR